MSPEDRQEYHDRAVESSDKRAQHRHCTLADDPIDNGISARQKRRLQGSQLGNSIKGGVFHPCWATGLGLWSINSPVKPAYIDVETSDQ